MNMRSDNVWRPSDERQYQKLATKRTRTHDRDVETLTNLVKEHGHAEYELMAEGMIKNADVFRDALEPFDSGVRATQPIIEF